MCIRDRAKAVGGRALEDEPLSDPQAGEARGIRSVCSAVGSMPAAPDARLASSVHKPMAAA
eukprot:11427189-Alexandrium_andersonii.AAC.1